MGALVLVFGSSRRCLRVVLLLPGRPARMHGWHGAGAVSGAWCYAGASAGQAQLSSGLQRTQAPHCPPAPLFHEDLACASASPKATHGQKDGLRAVSWGVGSVRRRGARTLRECTRHHIVWPLWIYMVRDVQLDYAISIWAPPLTDWRTPASVVLVVDHFLSMSPGLLNPRLSETPTRGQDRPGSSIARCYIRTPRSQTVLTSGLMVVVTGARTNDSKRRHCCLPAAVSFDRQGDMAATRSES